MDFEYVTPAEWIDIKKHPLTQEDGEVIGYNPEWIDHDFNPNGTRIGFIDGDGNFTSAKWVDTHDYYATMCEPGDDHDTTFLGEPYYYKPFGNGYRHVKGSRPNMPTHYMIIPKHP